MIIWSFPTKQVAHNPTLEWVGHGGDKNLNLGRTFLQDVVHFRLLEKERFLDHVINNRWQVSLPGVGWVAMRKK